MDALVLTLWSAFMVAYVLFALAVLEVIPWV